MSKLFNLKEWLTVAESAQHLSIVFGEDVTEADVLRLALDRRLRLSVNFVNGARGRCGRVVPIDEAEYVEVPAINGNGTVRLYGGPQLYSEGRVTSVVKLEDEVSDLRGIYDLPMIGNEKLDVENAYQHRIGGPTVTLIGLDGAFVEGRDGQIAQILDIQDDNPYQEGSTAQLERLQQRRSDQYYPIGLPEDGLLVVRTDSLREFEAMVAGSKATNNSPETFGRREQQHEIILAVIAALGFDPLKIPDGGKSKIKAACLTRLRWFTADSFDHAWKAGADLFRMANHEKFISK